MFSFIKKNTIAREFLFDYVLYFPFIVVLTAVLGIAVHLTKNNFLDLIRVKILAYYCLVHAVVVLVFLLAGNEDDVKKFLRSPFSLFTKSIQYKKIFTSRRSIATVGILAVLFVCAVFFHAWATLAMFSLFVVGLIAGSTETIDILFFIMFSVVIAVALLFKQGYLAENAVFIFIPLFLARLVKTA